MMMRFILTNLCVVVAVVSIEVVWSCYRGGRIEGLMIVVGSDVDT
jgi:hypothetical protein